MARVKGAMMTRKRRNKTLKLAKSYWGSKSRHFKMAKQAVAKSGVYAYVGRKLKKREFRQLWISRGADMAFLDTFFETVRDKIIKFLLKMIRL